MSNTIDSTIALHRSPGLYLITNTPKGRGVFANHTIPSGTIIDTCPVLVLDATENDQHIAKTSLYHYTYNWPATTSNENGKSTCKTQAVVFGLGSMFNHSTARQNVGWQRDVRNQVIVYRALRDIPQGEELCISYGDRLTFTDADAAMDDEGVETGDDVLGGIELGG